ncbi:kunitz:Bovine pancreatic trypsin [Trichuris trichiura]|uniref:Kunitz:Bovine pancreatic trypsin n=1 Tax=Trichuris trichiura TaxID=36087 RepID=A0A077ZFK9_TRITR|nr:kunitz:Bovine pancreatic trypsin [Trichuris trichiura]
MHQSCSTSSYVVGRGQCQPEPRLLCDPETYVNAPVGGQLSLYTFCNKDRLVEVGQCQQGYIFDYENRSCQPRKPFLKRRRQIYAIVGNSCNENIDCQTTDGGAYCDTTKRCACLPSFVNIHGFCYRKINPGQSGCSYPEQCNSVWPGAYCYLNECKCPDGQPPQRTRDGTVCTFPGFCPTNGAYSKLKGADGIEASCLEGSDDYCPPTYDCLCNPPAKSAMSACEGATFCCPSRGCPRGQPLYSPGSMTDRIPKGSRVACSASQTCIRDSNFFCHVNQVAGGSVENYCCPRPSFICSQEGGLPTGSVPYVVPPTPYDSGLSGGVSFKQRYYYDTAERRCKPFEYLGQAGNFNNFDSEAECKQFCSRIICIAGEPMRDQSDKLVTCGAAGTGICPLKYDCTNEGFCCPSRGFVCNQEQAIGSCINYVERWYFNPKSRGCERFYFSGCHGNANNFESYEQCMSFCGTSPVEPKCPQGFAFMESSGIYTECGGASASYSCPADYFCHFDGQRFGCCPTRRCPEGGEPYKEMGTGQYRICDPATLGCPVGFICTPTTIQSLYVRNNYCCATRATICSLSRDQGVQCGSSSLMRYYFNTVTKTCESLTYLGCGGNRNNFPTKEKCLSYCQSADCPLGQVALREHNSYNLVSCSRSSNVCPHDYSCIHSKLLATDICCGSSAPAGTCPAGQSAYMDALTNSPRQCQPNIDNSCPQGFFCTYSGSATNSFCCGTAMVHCPQGGEPYMEPFLNTPRQCTPGVANTCPANYACQTTLFNVGGVQSATGFCCGTPNVCPPHYAPFVQNNQPVTCIPTAFPSVCPAGYTCQRNSMLQQSYCCILSNHARNPCEQNKTPYRVQGAPVVCTQGSTVAGCPPGYTCDLNAESNSFYCCSFSPGQPMIGNCPPGYTLVQPSRYCSPNVPGSCGPNSICHYDSSQARYVCCSSVNIVPPPSIPSQFNPCPPPRQPFYNPTTGQPLACLLGTASSGCPNGYNCAYSAAMKNYFCCSRTGSPGPTRNVCPAGQEPAIDPMTRQPRICPLNVPGFRCPPGYRCTYRAADRQYYCCRAYDGRGVVPGTSQFNEGCPRGRPYIYPGTKTPLSCSPWGSRCPTGHSCLQAIGRSGYLCCSSNVRNRPLPLSSVNDTPNAVGSPCTSDSDCRPNPGEESVCHDGACACSHKEKNLDGQCVAEMCPVPYENVDGQCQAPQT